MKRIKNAVRRRYRLGQVFCRYIPHYLRGRQVIHFLHIGKTGGTAVKTALQPVTTTNSFHLILHDHQFRLVDIPPFHKFMFFLRDPASRFVSGFNSRKREGRPRYNVPWNDEERIAFSQFSSPNELATALYTKDDQRREAAQNAMHSIRHINKPYSFWFGNMSFFMSRIDDLFFVGFQETLEKDLELLQSRLQLHTPISLPINQKDAHIAPAVMDTSLEPRAVANLKRWYKKDYEFINFCKSMYLSQFKLSAGR